MSPAVLMLFITLPASSQPDNATRPWKGYSILGNGNLTVAYSDDPRISDATHARGIQHFYFGDYTADYVASTSFRLRDLAGSETIGMKNFFTAQTQTHLVDAGSGARYDEPEWDENGYYIYLVNQYHQITGTWLVEKELLCQLADFLVDHLDANGLLYEGGIVEDEHD